MPIGTLMFFGNTFDPNTYFMGTWEKIEEEVFFMTSSSKFPVGQVSGSNTHTLTIDEMPSHTHEIWYGYGTGSETTYSASVTNKSISGSGSTYKTDNQKTGGGQAFDVRPRRYAVNAWVRVS